MTQKPLSTAIDDNWRAQVVQVYDIWHGWYQVVELVDGRYQPRRVLTRNEALNWQNPDPNRFALNMKHVQRWSIYGPLPT